MDDRESARQRGVEIADRMWYMGHPDVERITREIDALERMLAYKRGQLSRLLGHLADEAEGNSSVEGDVL